MKSKVLIFVVFILLDIVFSPLRAIQAFVWSEILSFVVFFVATVWLISKFNNKVPAKQSFLIAFLAVFLFNFVFSVFTFPNTIGSIFNVVLRLLGIVAGYGFVCMSDSRRKVIYTIVCFVVAFLVSFFGNKLLHEPIQNVIMENIAKRDNEQPTLSFETTSHSFGKIDKNTTDNVSFDFKFANVNGLPLVIEKVDVSCDCLTATYPDTVDRGMAGVIRITIDTKKVEGRFEKSIFVKSNALQDVVLLKVDGEVE